MLNILNKKSVLSNEDDVSGFIEVVLTQEETQELQHIYTEMKLARDHLRDDEMLPIAKFFSFMIKKKYSRINKAINSLKNVNTPSGIFIQGLPILQHESEQIALGELVSLTFSLVLGEPFQYSQQNNGKLVAHISPQPGFESTQSGYSRDEFGWHTDDRYFLEQFRTNWIQLFAIHNPGKAKTLIAPIDNIVEYLSSAEIEILMQKRFEVKMPTSFGFLGSMWSEPVNILWKNKHGQFEVGIPTYHARARDENDFEAARALNNFIQAIEKSESGITLVPGSLLIFNNNRVLHGRTAFQGDRLILRTYIREDLNALRQKTNTSGHVFDARFLL